MSRFEEFVALFVAIALVVTANGSHGAVPRCDIAAQYDRSAGPMTAQLDSAFAQGANSRGMHGVIVAPSSQALPYYLGGSSATFDAVLAQQWASVNACRTLTSRFPATADSQVYLIGERRLALIVHPTNDLKAIRLTALHRILAALGDDPQYQLDITKHPGKEWPARQSTPAQWNDVGGKTAVPVCVYAEGASSWTREELSQHYLKCQEMMQGCKSITGRPYRRDIVECIDPDDVINHVSRDPAGIGLVQYTGQKLRGVKVLAIEDDFPEDWSGDFDVPGPILPVRSDGTVDLSAWEAAVKAKRPTGPIAMKLGRVLQPEYPLSEPLLLFVHPKAPQNVKDFAAWCVSEPGANIAETLGLITPFADAQTKAQQRLADLRAGKGEILTACGQGSLYYLARDLTLAFTRSTRPVELKYEPETTNRLATLFLQGRHSVLLSWGTPIGVLPAGNPKLETRNPKQDSKPELESSNPVGPAAPAARSVPY